MSPRLVIAAQTGALIGLAALAVYQAVQLRYARHSLASPAALPELPAVTNQRPLRLKLQSLPPIQIRTEIHELNWSQIESGDYATYVANLRRIGCPEETIRDIILADINKVYAARRRALKPTDDDWAFWLHPDELRRDSMASDEARDRETSLAALERERRQLVLSLLGESAVVAELAERATEASEDRALQFLETPKRDAIAQAAARLRLAIEEAELVTDPDQRREAQDAAGRVFDATLATVLSPEEREQYRMRTSPMADELRERLRGFGATREEFEQIYKLASRFEEQRGDLKATLAIDPQAADKLDASETEEADKLRQLLGPQRFADFQRSRDPDYQTLYSLAVAHDVSTDVAGQVWSMRSEVELQTDRIRANPILTVEQKARALEAIRGETQAAIVDVLGEPLLHEYERQGGAWLVDLTEAVDLGESGRAIVPPPLPEMPVRNRQQAGFLPPGP